MKDSRVTVRFSADLRQRLRDVAQRNGTKESEIIRKAVERQFAAEDQEMTAYDRAKTAGLIGMVRGASRDLSTKEKHFEGFGNTP